MAKPRPKTGEKRETNQPLKIDRLPSAVHDAILQLRNGMGKTWQEIEALSAEPYNEGKGPGFIDWPDLPLHVLELFPDMRLPHSSLHRWHDLRIEQVRKDLVLRSKQAQIVAKAFVKSGVVGDDEAVINAARDTLMGVLAEDGSEKGRMNATKSLIKLGELMQKAKTNDIRERKVNVEEQTLQLKLDEIKRRTEALMLAAGKGDGKVVPLSVDQLMEHVRGIYGVA